MIIVFARKSMLFHSPSSIFDDFFSILSRALYMPSFTSNDVTRIFHKRKLNFLLNFSTLNLVVVVVLLAITLILLMINLRSNNSGTPSRRLGYESRSVKDLSLANNHHTTKEHKI